MQQATVKKAKEKTMSDDKLKFQELLNSIIVTDDNDRNRKFQDAVETLFQEVSRKVSEYRKDGELKITLKFQCDKKSKTGVDVYAEISKKIPKGLQKNQFFSDPRTGGFYLQDPNQLKIFENNVTQINEQ